MADIDNPVDLSDYADIIAKNPHNDGKNWDLSCYDGLKKHVKRHYTDLQDDICFYCKIDINYAGYLEPIEHIVPKSDKPEWMFEPKNLAISCNICNTKKNADNTLSATGRKCINYPTKTNGFLIYHPHFDTWSTHFEEFHQFFLKAKTDKGRETFKVCELYRLDLPLNKAKKKNLKGEPFKIRIIQKVLMDPSITDEIKEQCSEIVKEIIRRAENKRAILRNKANPDGTHIPGLKP